MSRAQTERSRFTVDGQIVDLSDFFQEVDATDAEVRAMHSLDEGDAVAVRGRRVVREQDAPRLTEAEAYALVEMVDGVDGIGQLRGIRPHLRALSAKGLVSYESGAWRRTPPGRFEARIRGWDPGVKS